MKATYLEESCDVFLKDGLFSICTGARQKINTSAVKDIERITVSASYEQYLSMTVHRLAILPKSWCSIS